MRTIYQHPHTSQASLGLRTHFVPHLSFTFLTSVQPAVKSVGPASSCSDVQTEDSLELRRAGDGEGMPLEPADSRDVDEDVVSTAELELSLQHQPAYPGLESRGLHCQGVTVAWETSRSEIELEPLSSPRHSASKVRSLQRRKRRPGRRVQ